MRRFAVLSLVLLMWIALSIPRLSWPFHGGHDAFISSQLGQYAHNHLQQGLGVTKGANLTAVDYSGEPRYYYSYTPLASWLLAAPMALGVQFHTAVRTVTLCLSCLFLLGLWLFAGSVWGLKTANLTVTLMPFMLTMYIYGLSAIWEIMALGPLFCALALFSSRRPRNTWWFLGAILFCVCAVCLSWLCWLVILPCAWREVRSRRFAAGFTVGLSAIFLPIAWQLGALAATGISFAAFLSHCMDRMGATQWDYAAPVMGYKQLVGVFLDRSQNAFGAILFSLSILGLIYVASYALCRRTRGELGAKWLLVLVVFGLPLNLLARNVATYHDFFPILFAPVVAILTAILFLVLFEQLVKDKERQIHVPAFLSLLLAVSATTLWPCRDSILPNAGERVMQQLAIKLGDIVKADDVLLVSPGFVIAAPERRPSLAIPDRDFALHPAYGALTAKTGLVCYDSQELSALATRMRGHRIIVLDNESVLEPLPPGFQKQHMGGMVIAIRE
jgi:hypothetical protein